ncbi:MAG: hypothetical protein ACOY90_14495 [Candidatus Zhuqueibacterota bacterium]
MMKIVWFANILSWLMGLFLVIPVFAQEKPYYFYNPSNDFGSDLVFNHVTLLINGSFDILRNGNVTKDVLQLPYWDGFENVISNITHPLDNIEKYGWGNFFADEIFNAKGDMDRMQFLPNFSLHILGNGMQYVKLAEWCDYRGYPHPYIFSAATTISYQFLNEIVENSTFNGPNVDPIADLLIFNPLGFILFSTRFGRETFSKVIPIYDWSCQPYLNLGNFYLENAGQQFASKIQVSSRRHPAIFLYWGVNTIFGMSCRVSEHSTLSFGAGSVIFGLREDRQGEARLVTPRTKNAIGLFWDRTNSLMASAIIAGAKADYFKIEVFPGLLRIGSLKPGFFIGRLEEGNLQIGLAAFLFPLGFLHEFN